MSAASDYTERKVLDSLLGSSDPATVYFALFTSAPNDAGSSGNEVAGGSYARVAVPNDATNFPAAATVAGTSTKKNATDVLFPQATANWGTVTHWAIFDAAAAGTLLLHGALTQSREILNGDVFRFLSDAFSLRVD